jgi:hypothetical protein
MAKSEARKIAELQCRTQLQSQALGILQDPLWSTILGFVAVHELRKQDYVGPVADDILYAGIIAINSARQPGLQDLAGKALDTAGLIGAAGAGAVATKLLTGGGAAAGGAAAGAAAARGAAARGAAGGGASLIPAAGVLALAAGSTYAGLKLTSPKNPLWKRIVGYAVGGPITGIYRAAKGATKK